MKNPSKMPPPDWLPTRGKSSSTARIELAKLHFSQSNRIVSTRLSKGISRCGRLFLSCRRPPNGTHRKTPTPASAFAIWLSRPTATCWPRREMTVRLNFSTSQDTNRWDFLAPDSQPGARIEISGDSRSVTSDNDSNVSVTFSSRGSLVAAGGRDGAAHVWSLPSGRELLRVMHSASLAQVMFRPPADQLVTAGDDGHVRVFDIPRAAVVADFRCPDKVVSVVFTPDGNVVAALSADGSISVFDFVHGKLLRTMPGGEAAFNLAISKDGRRLAAAGGDFAFAWDLTTGRQLLKATHAASSETLTPQQWIVDASISPDGRFLAYAARGHKLAHVSNIDIGREVTELKHDSAVAAVAFSADGTKLGTGSYDSTARVWELSSGGELERISHPGGAEVVAFNSTGSRFAAGGIGGSVSVSETHRADRPAYFDLPSAVRSVAFSPDGRRIAAGSVSIHNSPLVRIAETGGKTLRDIEFHGAPSIDKLFFLNSDQVLAQWSDKFFLIGVEQSSVTPLPDVPGKKQIDPSGKVLAVQQNGVNKLYTLPGLQQTTSLPGSVPTLLRVAAEGKLLAFEKDIPPNQVFVEIWSIASQARVSRIQLPAELTCLAFNSSGTVMYTAEGEDLQAWEIPSGKRRLSLRASDDIDVILPDPSSAFITTITHGQLTVWGGLTGSRLAQLPDSGYIRAATFSPDGRYLLAGYDERFAALWLWRLGDLRDEACGRLSRNLSHDEWARWFPKQPYRQICPNLPAAN